MLFVDAMLLLIDSLIVMTAIMIIPIVVVGLLYNNDFRLDDE